MTTWTEAQIDRHLHLWEHRHGPDSPEAGIVRQLRAERDKAREVLKPFASKVRSNTTDPLGLDRFGVSGRCSNDEYRAAYAAYYQKGAQNDTP